MARRGTRRGLFLVPVYNYTSDKDKKEQRATLRDDLADEMKLAPPTAQLIVGGDFNAEVGVRDKRNGQESSAQTETPNARLPDGRY